MLNPINILISHLISYAEHDRQFNERCCVDWHLLDRDTSSVDHLSSVKFERLTWTTSAVFCSSVFVGKKVSNFPQFKRVSVHIRLSSYFLMVSFIPVHDHRVPKDIPLMWIIPAVKSNEKRPILKQIIASELSWEWRSFFGLSKISKTVHIAWIDESANLFAFGLFLNWLVSNCRVHKITLPDEEQWDLGEHKCMPDAQTHGNLTGKAH